MGTTLDALKKSESDRERQSGPGAYEVKVAPPKARFHPWAVAVAVLRGVNMVMVGWLLLHRTSMHTDASPASAAASSSVAAATRNIPPPPASAPTRPPGSMPA